MRASKTAGRAQGGRAPVLRHRLIHHLAVIAAAVAPVTLVAPASAGEPSTSLQWRAVAKTSAFLEGLVAPSRHSIWALGTGQVSGNPEKGFPFGLHWNGRGWSRVTFPRAISKTGIGCAGASSARDVWAFAGTSSAGSDAAAAGALRLVRGHWKLVKTFPPGIVTSCLVVDATDVWVFGDAHVAPGTGTWHLHGHTWTHLATKGFVLEKVRAIARNDIWAEAETGFGVPIVARWNGRSWVRNRLLSQSLPTPSPNVQLFNDGINPISDMSVWLRMLIRHVSGGRTTDSFLVLHWNGSAWHKVGPSNVGYYLPGAVRSGDGSWWSYLPVDPFGPVPAGVRHLVKGSWVKVPVKIAGCLAQRPYLLAPAGASSTMLGLQFCPSGAVTDVLARGSIR